MTTDLTALIERMRDKWLKADSIRLHAGEMSAQEMRTAQAVAKAIIGEVEAAADALASIADAEPVAWLDVRNEPAADWSERSGSSGGANAWSPHDPPPPPIPALPQLRPARLKTEASKKGTAN